MLFHIMFIFFFLTGGYTTRRYWWSIFCHPLSLHTNFANFLWDLLCLCDGISFGDRYEGLNMHLSILLWQLFFAWVLVGMVYLHWEVLMVSTFLYCQGPLLCHKIWVETRYFKLVNFQISLMKLFLIFKLPGGGLTVI